MDNNITESFFDNIANFENCISLLNNHNLSHVLISFSLPRSNNRIIHIIFYDDDDNIYFSILFNNYILDKNIIFKQGIYIKYADYISSICAGTIIIDKDDYLEGKLDIYNYIYNKHKYNYPDNGILGSGTKVIRLLEYFSLIFGLKKISVRDVTIIGKNCEILYSIIRIVANIKNINSQTWYESLGYEYSDTESKKLIIDKIKNIISMHEYLVIICKNFLKKKSHNCKQYNNVLRPLKDINLLDIFFTNNKFIKYLDGCERLNPLLLNY